MKDLARAFLMPSRMTLMFGGGAEANDSGVLPPSGSGYDLIDLPK